MSFKRCHKLAVECISADKKRYQLKRLHFAARLFFGYSSLPDRIESFFGQTPLRHYLMALPRFKEHIYRQQVRSCFYRNSTAHYRWHFLQSHFSFLESTHQEKIIKAFYTNACEPIVIQQDNASLSFQVGYQDIIAREGLLCLTMKMDDVVLYKITFWLMEQNTVPTLCIGALQGGQNTLEENRLFTKVFWGLRPQNMAITVLRAYAQTLGVEQIFTFPKHKLWCQKISEHAGLDEFWQEQGAKPVVGTPFIELDLVSARKDINDVVSKKRSMYKKRYDFLDKLQIVLTEKFSVYLKFSTAKQQA